MQNKPRLLGVLFKATVLFLLFNFAFVVFWGAPFGKLTIYNSLVPGRQRFPFGEAPQAYNRSLFDLDAMFASHIIDGTPKAADEYRVLLIGDSSVWGTLLTPEQTLAGQLNARDLTACSKKVHVYNLGYPYISLAQELLILDQARKYQPDMVIWLTTLESLPREKQLGSPLVANNPDRIRAIIARYKLSLDPNDPALDEASQRDQTFVGRRREIADLFRLQMNGLLWAATGIDQYYPKNYEHAQIDLEDDKKFHDLTPSADLRTELSFDILDAGMTAVDVPTLLVNEPILISNGRNSDIRYNFFYPRWAYDEYRSLLAERAQRNHWNYLDTWNLVPMQEFTNSGVHMTPYGESLLTEQVAQRITMICK
ncbi:MAG TPA: hypothetical protein VK909_17540 [Anaerolineales bacterium]|nr:hypothetical protein [Anaerolineales bacterium]